METRKLYYEDSRMRQFTATVLSCEEGKKGFEIVLDATAFYPEGGGQDADTGTLGGVRVLDTRDREGTVVHICDGALAVGETVEGEIDYRRRFLLMQQHSGEHILSGVIHRRYGYHNTGFHMGSEDITVDFDGVIPPEDLPEIEAEVNRAVWENIPIRCWYPSPEELPNVFYRTKKALPWPVRIVEVPGYDSCACCGVHVERTGEIGLVKLFSVIGFRGGSRMEMACGAHALEMLNRAFAQNKLVSQAFSAKWEDTGEAAQRMNQTLEAEKFKSNQLQKQIFALIAESYVNCGDVLRFEPGLQSVQIRELADAIAENCGGVAAVFSGEDGKGYGYAMVTRQGDIREFGRELTKTLSGRGGGKPNFQQGSVAASRAEIEAFFNRKAGGL